MSNLRNVFGIVCIAFGTAGLRARMEAGFSRLNSLTIIQASQGLASYLDATVPGANDRGVVIGHDARHNSRKFARLTAAAFVARNIKVWWYEDFVHTPLVPFGVQELKSAAGVMITASHNPAQDNGYKVYLGNGCQIIPPHDSKIAAAILENLEPISWDESVVDGENGLVENVLDRISKAYYTAVAKVAATELPLEGIQFVYTPMHGVGLPYMREAMRRLGLLGGMTVVEEQASRLFVSLSLLTFQASPDPDFPTVKFPNPEEKGALDLALETANREGIDFVIANDPDADRLAVAEKVDGEWHQFTGNQLGVLLASHVLSTHPSSISRSKVAMLTTAVSTSMLQTMAETECFTFQEMLTGFKWLGNAALALEADGYSVPFAFEEAIGYMFTGVVHDKDAIAAGAVFLTAVAHWRSASLTPWTALQQLYARYGHFATANTYLLSPSPSTTDSVFAAIRALGDPYPATLGTRKVRRWRDLTLGYDSSTPDKRPVLPVSKDSQMLTAELEGHVKLTVRGSGTEPKIKLYIECKAPSAEEARRGAEEVAAELERCWFRPDKTGLTRA
ncbi:MAG: Phosphoglucomutase-3 [Thelocarpon impressellum]|nr:MAG: Phosphoglucomutase-3 [Thelocarpon impressellum]